VTLAPDWRDLGYLARGSARQRQAYRVLGELDLLGRLRPFDPILVGTIPLEVDIESSDLDIACCVRAREPFVATVQRELGTGGGLVVQPLGDALVVYFSYGGWAFELFGQPLATEAQAGFRHLEVEWRLLQLGGAAARDAIRAYKRDGLKTEPAFARYFDIPGDPYATLLEWWAYDDAALSDVARRRAPAGRLP
jgi:hypothetical protein